MAPVRACDRPERRARTRRASTPEHASDDGQGQLVCVVGHYNSGISKVVGKQIYHVKTRSMTTTEVTCSWTAALYCYENNGGVVPPPARAPPPPRSPEPAVPPDTPPVPARRKHRKSRSGARRPPAAADVPDRLCLDTLLETCAAAPRASRRGGNGRRWTPREDAALHSAMEEQGYTPGDLNLPTHRWEEVSKSVSRVVPRSVRQCRERWRLLDPRFKEVFDARARKLRERRAARRALPELRLDEALDDAFDELAKIDAPSDPTQDLDLSGMDALGLDADTHDTLVLCAAEAPLDAEPDTESDNDAPPPPPRAPPPPEAPPPLAMPIFTVKTVDRDFARDMTHEWNTFEYTFGTGFNRSNLGRGRRTSFSFSPFPTAGRHHRVPPANAGRLMSRCHDEDEDEDCDESGLAATQQQQPITEYMQICKQVRTIVDAARAKRAAPTPRDEHGAPREPVLAVAVPEAAGP